MKVNLTMSSDTESLILESDSLSVSIELLHIGIGIGLLVKAILRFPHDSHKSIAGVGSHSSNGGPTDDILIKLCNVEVFNLFR